MAPNLCPGTQFSRNSKKTVTWLEGDDYKNMIIAVMTKMQVSRAYSQYLV